MAKDKNGNAVHPGDKVRLAHGKEHYVNGVLLPDGTVVGSKIGGAKFVAFARDLEVIEKSEANLGAAPLMAAAAEQDQSIVWGNGN